MTSKQKTRSAGKFILSIKDRQHILELTQKYMGESLVNFFWEHAMSVLSTSKQPAVDGASLMILGYLARAQEEAQTALTEAQA